MPALTRLVLPFLLLLAALTLGACAEVSPAYGQYFQGRTLVVSVVNIERVPELRYAVEGQQSALDYMRVAPSEPDLELVVVHLKVQNHTATSAIINVNKQGAELQDFDSEKYFPIEFSRLVVIDDCEFPEEHCVQEQRTETDERVQRVDYPPDRHDRSAQILELQKDGTFAPSRGFINGPFELNKGTGLDGWMVFEAPPDAKFRTFRWRAGDSLTITF